MSQSYVRQAKSDKHPFWKNNIPSLIKLDIELTERCNNNCMHCYINLPADDLAAKDRELSTGEIKDILSEAAALSCLTVRFTGGEPLLREDFEELYVATRKLGFKVALFTNATLITEHLAELFSRIPPLQKIEITVYGMKKKSYESVTRGPGSFEAARKGINLLLKKKIPFIVKGVFLTYDEDELDAFETWAATIPWMHKVPSYSMFFDFHCRRDKEKNRIIRKIRMSAKEGLKFLTRRKDEFIKENKEFCSRFIGPSGDKLFSCGSGLIQACIDAYGILQPCIMLRHPNTVYDLKKGSLKDALTNFFPKLRETKATNPEYLARCARCFLKGFCEQCPAKSWMEHGTLDTPVEYFCELAHTQARFLGLLKNKELAWEVKDWQSRVKEFTGKDTA